MVTTGSKEMTMSSTILFEDSGHRNVLLPLLDQGQAVSTNQHLIVHGDEGMILDPGGHKIYSKVLSETTGLLGAAKLSYVFLSHQDPDIVAAVNGWLMTTDAVALAPSLWTRFIPHFGLDNLVAERLKAVPDEGQRLLLGGTELYILPAHFLHSCGNLHVYDPVSKILYSGDLGASVSADYREVSDFDAHVEHLLGFHQRYMSCNKAMRAWAGLARQLDIEIIAPQHGALFRGKELVGQFIDWVENLECGIDLMADAYKIPAQ